MSAIYIAPAVTNHPTLRQINVQFARRAEQHAGLRLAAVAVGFTLSWMKTNLHAVNGKLLHQVRVNIFHEFLFQGAASDIRLIRRNDQQKFGGFQFRAGVGNFGKDFKFIQASRRKRFAVAFQRAVDYAIAVKENSAVHFRFPLSAFRFYFVDSHFVWPIFNFGCDTSKCQTTA